MMKKTEIRNLEEKTKSGKNQPPWKRYKRTQGLYEIFTTIQQGKRSFQYIFHLLNLFLKYGVFKIWGR